MASADFRRVPSPLTDDSSARRQVEQADPRGGSPRPPFGGLFGATRPMHILSGSSNNAALPPRIRRMAVTAQDLPVRLAPLDLPMRMNEDGFVMLGSLACSHRPCIEFLFVTSQPPMVARSFDENAADDDT